ncbi:MAG TPA: MOSC domain-containing protein [Nocardioidaceae bacterium]|nr:MOSC domain-containing protein [Nocardioidaceae bacterium]
MTPAAPPTVRGVSKDTGHRFSKLPCESVELVEGLGVGGDAHAGATVQHRSRVRVDPTQPNLRQVHLLHAELFELVRRHGFELRQGDLGENLLTEHLDLLSLPQGTLLAVGADAVVRVTGLRNPCRQIDGFQAGLLKLMVARDRTGQVQRRAGIMAVVERGGMVRPGDAIQVQLPPEPHLPLHVV